jgi:hypothetical protein
MATLSSAYITLADITKRQTTDKSISDIVEILAQQTPVARAGYVEVCNEGKKHRTTLRAALPSSPTWVQYYSRLTPVKSTTRQVEDTTGMAEAMTSIDKRLYDATKDKAKLRLQEAVGVLETFAQELESTFFYGNTASSPLEFLGLAPRMNNLSTAENKNQIVDGGGTGSTNTSIYGVTWGPRSAHLLIPEGVPGGVVREDKGEVRDSNSDGVIYLVEEIFKQHMGFAMPDWRYQFRVANIDVNTLGTSSEPDLVNLIISAYYRMPSRKSTTGFSSEGMPVSIMPAIYVNSRIKEALHKQMLRQPNGMLTKGEFFGEEVMMCLGMAILETDGIVSTESRVT